MEIGKDGTVLEGEPRMLLRAVCAATALTCCVLVSARFLVDLPDADPATERSWTLSLAPVSLGNPATAATLKTRPETTPGRAAQQPDTPFRYSTPLRTERGDTLAGMLAAAGVGRREAAKAIAALDGVFDPRRIKPGQEVTVDFQMHPELSEERGRFVGFRLEPDFARRIIVARASDEDDDFKAHEAERALTTAPIRFEGDIDSSLFVAADNAGIPAPVIVELIRLFSWDVDFQRDIRPGDSFALMYDRLLDESGAAVHNGDIQFAAMTLSGERHVVYRFESEPDRVEYFDESGRSARKALMRTPIDGARLSSRYGKRKHPILGYTKKHTGVDFAAPPGTPIYAAGDGRVEMAKWYGGYGRYIRIRHNADYQTAYGHMRRFAKGMAPGKRVRQGQVIGYVGTSGRSTGPHLHYEILVGGKHTNPLKVRMPSGRQLKGTELARFQDVRTQIDVQYAKLTDDTELASRPETD